MDSLGSGSQMRPAVPQHTDVFVSGQDGVCQYRVPALVCTGSGSLVAVCEARRDGPDDAPANIDLVCKRSTDGGNTWSPMQVIRSHSGDEAACNPCLLADRQAGKLWLFYDCIMADRSGDQGRTGSVHVMHSGDEGVTWSEPTDLSAQLQAPPGAGIHVAPGIGIRMQSGRLVVPVYVRAGECDPARSHVIYSDDCGEIWQLGGGAGEQTDLHQVVELHDGSLMTLMRQVSESGCRAAAISADGGQTWSQPWDVAALVDPGCQASFIRHTDRRDGHPCGRLLFANPADSGSLYTGTVRIGYETGPDWLVSRAIYAGQFGYSCLTVLADQSIGLLFECDDYARIHFFHFTLEWLSSNRDRLSDGAPGGRPARNYTIPLVDLAGESHRQVVVDREPGQYLGHPTTVLLDDRKTIICVYPKGHGRGAVVMKRSDDGGLTWSRRLPVPDNWATSRNVPTLYKLTDRGGIQRLVMFSGFYPIRMAVSEDSGHTWSGLQPIGDFGGIVTMADVMRLKDGRHMACFHDTGSYLPERDECAVFTVYKTLSEDGGLTWSAPQYVVSHREAHLCEPGLVRSPDGNQIAMLLRENSRRLNSFITFSDDEGESWTDPRQLPAALTGDRHQAIYTPDGRLFISFRDTTHLSPTYGDWLAWVGTYEDLVEGREGQCRVRLMRNYQGRDCAYPALELLPDGTIVAITYGHWVPGEPPFIVEVRLKIEEIDARAG